MSDSVIERRNPRTMNHMDKETKLIHAYLEQWGRETRERPATGLPPVTLLGRVVEQGPVGASIHGHGSGAQLSDRSARVDACVCRLWKAGQSIVKAYYCTSTPIEAIAARHQLKVRQLQESLRRSRHLIGLWLEDMDRNTYHVDLSAQS